MDQLDRVRALPLWRGQLDIVPLTGGMTNRSFVVADGDRRVVVRLGEDIPVHGIHRFAERSASEAAWAAGLSPAVLYAEPGLMAIAHIEGTTLTAEAVRQPHNLDRILPLIARVHTEMPKHLRGAAMAFWVFHVLRDYGHALTDGGSRHLAALPGLMAIAQGLEAEVGPVTLVFGHNDLLPGNLIDDGTRLWLIDWEYAGFNSPLFDLANLASNNGLTPEQEDWLLASYFGIDHSGIRQSSVFRAYSAMKCASLLRETLWSMVSELHSTIDFNYAAYTKENWSRFDAAYAEHRASWPM
jgi:thiamine kinase-like enzyme